MDKPSNILAERSPGPAARAPSPGYQKTAGSIVNQYRRHARQGRQWWPQDEAEWAALIEWMAADLAPRVAASSWCRYRAAVQAVCPYPRIAHELWRARYGQGQTPKRTAAMRQKLLSAEELAKLAQWLQDNAPTWGPLCALWLEAGVLTGLRPSEWPGASLRRIQGRYFLRARNGKQGAGNDQMALDLEAVEAGYRFIPLWHLGYEEISVIRNHLYVVGQIEEHGAWDAFYEGCRQALYRANKAVFPGKGKTITLYTGRHQYATGLRKGAMDEPLGALLMGQRSGATYGKRYGSRRGQGEKALAPAQHAALEMFLRELQDGEASGRG